MVSSIREKFVITTFISSVRLSSADALASRAIMRAIWATVRPRPQMSQAPATMPSTVNRSRSSKRTTVPASAGSLPRSRWRCMT